MLLKLFIISIIIFDELLFSNQSSLGRIRSRPQRYIGLNKNFKINRRYQECIGPGDAKGHCKHIIFCPIDVLTNTRQAVDYLCVIEDRHVGVCCPDDVALSGVAGSQIIMDLPGGGNDYDPETDSATGCGLVTSQLKNEKSTYPWPWMAALYNPQKFQQGVEQQFCGGALLTEYHILTAAHCTIGKNAEDVRVRLGEYDFGKRYETRARDYTVAEIINHSDFDTTTYSNDIAIVRIMNATSFNTYIWPICLPPLDLHYENEIAIVSGWGRQNYAGPVSKILMQVTIPIWSQEKCTDAFLQRITKDNLCAAGYNGGQDSCLGDSGGPLMFELNNGRWVTIGIVSWGIGCGDENTPGVYTKVSNYIPWIIRNTITK